MALIMVLLVLALLLMIVGEFAIAMRLEGLSTLNFRASVTAAYLAEAAYQRAVAEMLPDTIAHQLDEHGLLVFRRVPAKSPETPERRDIALGGGRLSYRITDEDARLDLNRATPELLHRLLTELGVEREVRDIVVDSILDWRDPNELHRLNGAESDYYLALPTPYRSKNANFDGVEELLQVRGVTPAIFYGTPESPGLAEYLTVVGTGIINVNTASDTILRVLGYARAEVELLKAGRPYLYLSALPSNLRRGSQRTRSEVFRIDASGEVPGQGQRMLTALVRRHQRGPDGTMRVIPLTWRWTHDQDAVRN